MEVNSEELICGLCRDRPGQYSYKVVLSAARYLKDGASMKRETCICTMIRNASRQITMMYDAALSPVDLRITQFTVLRILRKLGPLSVTRLADAGGLDRSTMGRNLDPLERRGLVGFTQGRDQRQRLAQYHPGRGGCDR